MPTFDVSLNTETNPLPSIPINFNASGNNTIIIGITGQIIRVFRFFVVVAGATNLTFFDGPNALTGPVPLAQNEAMVFTFDTKPWFLCSVGNNFIINSSPGVQVSGAAYYTQH
jgi:hypothetical protein